MNREPYPLDKPFKAWLIRQRIEKPWPLVLTVLLSIIVGWALGSSINMGELKSIAITRSITTGEIAQVAATLLLPFLVYLALEKSHHSRNAFNEGVSEELRSILGNIESAGLRLVTSLSNAINMNVFSNEYRDGVAENLATIDDQSKKIAAIFQVMQNQGRFEESRHIGEMQKIIDELVTHIEMNLGGDRDISSAAIIESRSFVQMWQASFNVAYLKCLLSLYGSPVGDTRYVRPPKNAT